MNEFDGQVAGNLLFRTLDAEARVKVMALAEPRTYQRGDTIIQEGAPDQDIFLLQKGRVEVQTLQEGFIIELNELGPGSVFGEVAEVKSVRRTATVIAKEDVEVLSFPGPELVAELRLHTTASKLLDHIVMHRAKDTISKTFGDE